MPKRLAKGATFHRVPSAAQVRPQFHQFAVTILTNAYSLSDSPIPAPLQHFTARTSVAAAVPSPLSLLLPHSSPAFPLFFFITFSIVTRQRLSSSSSSSGWRHSHTNRATLEGQQRGGSHLLLSPWSRDAGTGRAKVNNPKHTPYSTLSSRGTPMLTPPPHPSHTLTAKKQCARISKFY